LNRKLSIRLAVDLTMIILLFMASGYRITGNIIHELIGVSIFVFFIVHNVLNGRWYQRVFEKKNSLPATLNRAVNLLTLIAILVLLVSAVHISHTVFDFIPAEGSLLIRKIHVSAAYSSLILMSMHLGMHWGTIISMMRKMTRIKFATPFGIIMLRLSAVLIAGYGMYVSFERNVCSKLIAYYTYDFWNSGQSVLIYFIDSMSVMGIYVFGTHYVLKFVLKYKRVKG
jgi:hypothetical protein